MENKVIDLQNIEYLNDVINKNLIFDNEQSSLTLMALKKGSKRDLHVDEQDEVTIVIEGNIIITVGKIDYNLSKNQMIVMPAKVPHGSKALTDVKMLLLRPKHIHK